MGGGFLEEHVNQCSVVEVTLEAAGKCPDRVGDLKVVVVAHCFTFCVFGLCFQPSTAARWLSTC
nr:MAG TPA: hypothetical protein [Caudoviricetes sp.]